MISITIQASPSLKRLIRINQWGPVAVNAEMQASVQDATDETVELIKRRTPVGETGRARGSIRPRMEGSGGDIRGVVESVGVHYVKYLEWGTGLFNEHPGAVLDYIYPRQAKFLRWEGRGIYSGETYYRRRIRGMRARRMFRGALPNVERIRRRMMIGIVRRLTHHGG